MSIGIGIAPGIGLSSGVGVLGATYYISPSGDDGDPGTPAQPMKTFAAVLPLLRPGDTLVLMDGTYQDSTTGFCRIDPSITPGIVSGTPEARITVRAQNERAALIDMTTHAAGDKAGLRVSGVDYWDIRGLYVDGSDRNGAGSGYKSNVTVDTANHVRLYRVLSTHNNRYGNVHTIEFTDSSYCLAEECEVYWHHRHGIMSFQCHHNVYRRCIAGNRGWGKITGGYANVHNTTTGGDESMSFYRSSWCVAENCVSLSGGWGFQSHGGPLDGNELNFVPGNLGGEGNQFLGCIYIGHEGHLTQLQTVGGDVYEKTDAMKLDTRQYPTHTGTSRGGSTSTMQLATSASSATGAYVGYTLRITQSGAYLGEEGTISAYDGPSRVATISGTFTTWTGTPNVTYRVTLNQFWRCKDTIVRNFLIKDAKRGLILESDKGSDIQNVTGFNFTGDDCVNWHETDGLVNAMCSVAGSCSSSIKNSHFRKGTNYGMSRKTADARRVDGTDPIAQYCNVSGFDPADSPPGFLNLHPASAIGPSGIYRNCTTTAPINFTPADGDYSLVWVNPDNTVCKGQGEGGADMGANILFRYHNGVLTSTPLWDPATGEFPHGAQVSGVNDLTFVDIAEDPASLHLELNVNATTLPEGYGS